MKKIALSLVAIALIVVGSATFLRTADAVGGDPVISGTGRVGDTLTISSYGAVAGGPADLEYTWLWEGEEEPGPQDYDATHTVTPDDVGRELSVLIKPKRGERLVSNRIVASEGVLVAPAVVVTGTAKVGQTLSVAASGGTPGADQAVQWLRDGTPLPGATAASYRVAKADGGRLLAVRVTSSQAGASASRDSAARPVAAFNAARPKLKGATKVRKTLKVSTKGTWQAAGHRYSYQWLRNGKKISRATKTSYRLTSKDRGKRITIVVRATKPGFPTVSATSSRSAKVR